MKIANADKLIHHFENVVDVKLFTVPQIVTIIESFSIEIPDDASLTIPRHIGMRMVYDHLVKLHQILDEKKPGIDNKLLSEEQTDVPRLPLQIEPEFGGKCKPFIGGTN